MSVIVSIREAEWNDLGARLTQAVTTLNRMSEQTSADAARVAHLEGKAAAIVEAHSAWQNIGFRHTESSFEAMSAVMEKEHRSSTGDSRQGYALVLDYLRSY